MPIRIQLEGDTDLMVDVSLADWNKAFRRALKAGTMLEIQTDDGRILAINPHQVQYLEEVPEEETPAAAAPPRPQPVG
jgi:hypothetical protein